MENDEWGCDEWGCKDGLVFNAKGKDTEYFTIPCIKIGPDKIKFNRTAFPDWTPDDFAKAFFEAIEGVSIYKIERNHLVRHNHSYDIFTTWASYLTVTAIVAAVIGISAGICYKVFTLFL